VSSGIDLALALVEDDYGAELVRDVARSLVVYLKRPTRSPPTYRAGVVPSSRNVTDEVALQCWGHRVDERFYIH
jgi:transcriptional regulator GlxA family with amidase domain